MELLHVWLWAAGLFAVLRFLFVPLLQRRLAHCPASAAPRVAGLLAAASLLASATLLATISLGLLLGWFWIAGRQGGDSVETVAAGLERVRHWRELWSHWSPRWGLGTGALLVLAFTIFAFRKARIRCSKALDAAKSREFDLLVERWKGDKLESLPPTPEMEQLWQRRREAIQAFEQLPPPLPGEQDKRAEVTKYIEDVTRAFVILDLRRRMKDEPDPELVRLPEARTPWEKVQTFFVSQGLLVNLGRANRIVFALGILLLFPCLVGLARQDGEHLFQTHTARLEALLLKLNLQQVKQDWEAEKQRAAGQTALSAADTAAIAAIAREWEEEEEEDPLWQPAITRVAPGYAFRSMTTRDRILRRAAAQRPQVVEHRALAAADAPEKAPHATLEAAPPPDSPEAGRPRTEAGKRIEAELSQKAGRSPPQFMERLRKEAAAFQKPATAAQLRRAAVVQVTSAVVDGHGADGLFGKAAGALDASQREMLRVRSEAAADRFLASVSRGEPVETAIRQARSAEALDRLFTPSQLDDLHASVRRAATDLPDSAQTARRFAEHPPTLETKLDPATNRRAAEVLDEFRTASRRPPAQLASLTESLNSYPDYFPGQLGADLKTPRGQLTEKWEGGGGPGSSGRPTASSPSSSAAPRASSPTKMTASTRASFARARSFSGLRGFSRVGGVLIGRAPETAAGAKIESLRWELVEGDRVRLVLRDAAGQETRSVPHRRTVVAQALAYAADGRPLAVTMATAKPLAELKILLHPALIDSPLGAAVVELDRLVDTFTGRSKFRQEAEARVQQQTVLYRLAWAQRIILLDSPTIAQSRNFGPYIRVAGNYLRSERLRELASAGLAAGALSELGQPTSGPVLEVKSEFFEPTLVRAMQSAAAAAGNGRLDDFLGGIRAAFATTGPELRRLLGASINDEPASGSTISDPGAMLDAWLPMPPTFEIWSGVREKPFRILPGELLAVEGAPEAMPFDFMLQVAFTSDPAFGAERTQEEGTYSDSKPWEFPAIGPAIQKTVIENVAAQPKHQAVVREAAEFAILQRLFRSIFEGRLGEGFPIEDLDRLAAEVGSAPPPVAHTPRWNTRPGALEGGLFRLVDEIMKAGGSPAVTAAAGRCQALLTQNLERRDACEKQLASLRGGSRPGSPGELDAAWAAFDRDLVKWESEWAAAAEQIRKAGEGSPELEAALGDFLELSMAVKLRRTLNVQNEDRLFSLRQ